MPQVHGAVEQCLIHNGYNGNGLRNGLMWESWLTIIFSCTVWGPQLSKNAVNFQCDNASLVVTINKGSSKDILAMHLLRCLWFFVTHFNIVISSTHLPGVTNITADHLSRNNLPQTFQTTPLLSKLQTPL